MSSVTLEKRKFEEALQLNSMHAEARYLLGVCHLSSGDFAKSIEHFTVLLEQSPTFKKNAYILAAIAHKKLNDVQSALATVLTPIISTWAAHTGYRQVPEVLRRLHVPRQVATAHEVLGAGPA